MKRIVLIGSGNMATCLGVALHQAGHAIVQVYSTTPAHAQKLADMLGCATAKDMDALVDDADFYVLAVPDAAIDAVAKQLHPTLHGIVFHTSGSTCMDVLAPGCARHGVLYPLQTFSKEHVMDNFKDIPIFTEACTPAVEEQIGALARSLSARVTPMNSVQRRTLHVAAVFSCNFLNHLLVVAFELLQQREVSAAYLQPLVEETIRKAFETGNPLEVQTGPAVRDDTATLQKHLTLLAGDPLKKQLYTMMTDQIVLYHKK